MVHEHVSDDRFVDAGVAVNQDVSEARCSAKRTRQRLANPSGARQQIEELLIRARLPKTFVGHDVRSGIQRGLNRKLERVLHEAFLTDVGVDAIGMGERPQLDDVGLDQRELLGDEILVGHAAVPERR